MSGDFVTNTPQSFINSGVSLKTIDDPIRALGILIGPITAPGLNWDVAMRKMNNFVQAHDCEQLTLNGKIIVANASITGITVFYESTHLFYQHSKPGTK